MPPPRSVPLLTPVLAWLRWHRRSVAAALAVLALTGFVRSVVPDPTPDAVTVLVATHDLTAGTQLGAGDVRTAAAPAATIPDGALADLSAAVGRSVALGVRRGEVLTDLRLLGPGLLAGFDPGTVAVPVRLADDSAAGLVRAGDLVDVLAAGEGGSGGVAAGGARVLVAPTGGTESVVVLALRASASRDLARAAATSRLSLVLRAG